MQSFNFPQMPPLTLDRAPARIDGQVQLHNLEGQPTAPETAPLKAHAFNSKGQWLGSTPVDRQGNYQLALNLTAPESIEIVIGLDSDPKLLRQSQVYSTKISGKDWVQDNSQLRLRPLPLMIPNSLWKFWLPIQICVSGHVRKSHPVQGINQVCPVPFVKVEIFDVDRESCWWPYLTGRWSEIIDRKILRIPDLMRPQPIPRPDPGPLLPTLPTLPTLPERPEFLSNGFTSNLANFANFTNLANPGSLTSFASFANAAAVPASALQSPGMRPEAMPLNPTIALGATRAMPTAMGEGMTLTGEVQQLTAELSQRIDQLTLTSVTAPWQILPRCFYSRTLIATIMTDAEGYFGTCFKWSPFQVRQGRLRFDRRPDIIIRVTQTINGVDRVLYLDPYSSTRWNINSTHIDLFLDDDLIQCGDPSNPRPPETQVFFTRIGNDEVYQINQGTGLYNDSSLKNVAYGSDLAIHGVFGDRISRAQPLSNGKLASYYRLSYAKVGSPPESFKPLTTSLVDTRVHKGTFLSESEVLGPIVVGTQPALYKVRNTQDFYWYNLDWLGSWSTALDEPDTGKYVLKLELFDSDGQAIAPGQIDYRDGTATPGTVLPSLPGPCTLILTLDNQPPVLKLTTPATNTCGVIPWAADLNLQFTLDVSQENGRLHAIQLAYVKGIEGISNSLYSYNSPTGSPGSQLQTVSGNALLTGLTSTCAFALTLSAWPHIRNGYGMIYWQSQTQAIAIERCAPCLCP